MKNSKYWLIGFGAFCGLLALAFGVNVLFKIKTDGIFSAEWDSGDALNYMGTMVGAISTFVLSLVAYKQNEKLQKLEDNNYIALNSCMVLIDSIYVKPKAHIPVNYDIHEGQMLKEKDNIDAYLSGYDIKVNMKKLNDSMQATPSLIYVPKCMLFVGEDALEYYICTENVREGYTRVAILESGISFSCEMLVRKDRLQAFESAIKAEKNRLIIEFDFNVITDKYVMTKCKCRTECDYTNSGGNVIWKSRDPMVFFYGHELKQKEEIQVLGEL